MKRVLDIVTFILSLMDRDKKAYLSVKRLQNLLIFVYRELKTKGILDRYDIAFNLSIEAIERAVLYNRKILDINKDEDLIYLRNCEVQALVDKYELDDDIRVIVDDFVLLS